MLRRVELPVGISGVTDSAAEPEMIVKQVRHLPRCHTAKKSATAKCLTDFKGIPFVDPDISAKLRVERLVAEGLNARAVEKHVPAMKLFRRSNECKGGTAKVCRAALSVRDKERRPVVLRRDADTRRNVAIELVQSSGHCRSAATQCCRKPSSRLPAQPGRDRVVRFEKPALRTQKLLAHVSVATLHEQLLSQLIRAGEIDREVRSTCLRSRAIDPGELAGGEVGLKTIETRDVFETTGSHVSFATRPVEVHRTGRECEV